MSNGLVRQYSLCNVPGERDRYLIAVLRDPNTRGGSAFMHDCVQQGDSITISQPRNLFELERDARRSILFAGGIGMTPILAMAERLAQIDASFELHYCGRSRSRSEEHTSEPVTNAHLVCRLLLEKKKNITERI